MSKWICTVIVILASSAFADGLDVRLNLEPSETLPGVPVTAGIVVRNTSDVPIAIAADYLQFQLASSTGEPRPLTVAIPPQLWNGEGFARPTKYVLQPAKTLTLFIPPGIGFDSSLFSQAPLNVPGEYDITLVVKGSRERTGTSNVAHLRILTPTGDDAEIWRHVTKEVDDRSPAAFDTLGSCGLIEQHPKSRYYRLVGPWCALEVAERGRIDSVEYLTPIIHAAEQLPGATRDAIMYRIGVHFAAAAETAHTWHKPAEAELLAAKGKAFVTSMSEHATTEFGEAAASALRKEFHTEREWREIWEEEHRPVGPERAIVPFVNCVTDNGDGTFSVEFGYDNPNRTSTKRPAGDKNAAHSQAGDVAVPTEFRPGRMETAFVLKGARNTASWSIDGKTVTASPSSASKCSDLAVPIEPREPTKHDR